MAWPTTDDPKTVFVTIRLTESEAANLDAHVSLAGTTRSGFVRDSVRRVIAAEERKARKLNGQS